MIRPELINGLLACASLLLAGWVFFTKRQNRILQREIDRKVQIMDTARCQLESLYAQIQTDTGCKSVRELLLQYSRVLRVLPSSLGRFYQSHPYSNGYGYIPGPEIQRQVAVVGRALRGMQDPRNQFRPIMETVVIDQLMFSDELKEEFPDLLPLLEGLTFEQMVGLSLTVIDRGGISIPEALRRMNINVVQIA